jgi:RIP metalloprotease RseP
MISVLQNIFWLLVLLGVMILIHELGHFWAARLFNVRIDVFSFGFGPRLFGFRRGETDYRFSAILFGGYVKMAGEQPGDEEASLAASDYRLCRPGDEYRAFHRASDRPVHV